MLIIKICYSARLRLYVNLFKVPIGILCGAKVVIFFDICKKNRPEERFFV